MTGAPDLENWSCPLPLRDHPAIVLGHGGGGTLSAELVEHLFLPAYADPAGVLQQLGDAAIVSAGGQRLAMSTDSYVVRPRFFPGGNIGDLAVNGTVNDLAVSGATPLYLSVGMVLEEGLPLEELNSIAATMGVSARAAGVSIVTGDTKVVDSGHGDGIYINTAGIGIVPDGDDPVPDLEGVGVTERQGREARALHLHHGDVGVLVAAHDAGAQLAAVEEVDGNVGRGLTVRPLDHVVVREEVALGVVEEGRA